MRHYVNIEEVFKELLEPNMEEIEGTFSFDGKKYYITGKTLPMRPPTKSGLERFANELFRLYIEEINPVKEKEYSSLEQTT